VSRKVVCETLKIANDITSSSLFSNRTLSSSGLENLEIFSYKNEETVKNKQNELMMRWYRTLGL
jgi:hypothetical protein